MSDFRKKAIIYHFDHNCFPYFCFLGNVSKYGNHVTLHSRRATNYGSRKKNPVFIKTKGLFGDRGGVSEEKNSFIELI